MSLEKKLLLKVIKLGIIIKITQIILQLISSVLFEDQDHNYKLLDIPGIFIKIVDTFFKAFSRWDSIHYLFISKFGYSTLKNFAFQIYLPKILNIFNIIFGD